jgi:hypothetical protein
LIVEIFQIVRSEPLPVEGDPVAETSINQFIVFVYLFQRCYWQYLEHKKKNHKIVPITNLATRSVENKSQRYIHQIIKKSKNYA